jgi:retinol dehydrogenase-12
MQRVAVVTGATGGIGRWIARGLARSGHYVVLVGRDRARGEAALAWIAAQVPGAGAELVLADLSSLAATRALGSEIAARHPAIAILVANAGVFRARREVTAEGHEMVLAVNHLSPFVLIDTLRQALAAGAPSRVVVVGSSTSDRARIDPDNLELTHGWGMVRAYGQSKLALMMTSFARARQLADLGVTVNVVHPGTVATGLVRTKGVIGLAWRMMGPWVRTEQQGAETPLHVALAPEVAGVTGKYFKDRRVVAPNRLALDTALGLLVWRATERLSA